MDIIEQVTKWVENKFENVIDKDLKEKIVDENSSFDEETYVNYLLDKYLKEKDIKDLKEVFNTDSYYDLLYLDSENSTEEQSVQDSLESGSNEYHSFSSDQIIENLEKGSKEVKKNSLKVLEASAEDLINQPSWNKITDILKIILNKEKDTEILNLVLKTLLRPFRCPKKPQIITKGFKTIVEILINQIDMFNLEFKNSRHERKYNIEENLLGDNSKFGISKNKYSAEILVKLMWLLIDCQQEIPVKWVRFNESRFREIIFSFIHLLSATNTSENDKISGLVLLSVLSPKADWCRYWCHTAVGRYLLCSALRKYKNFFTQVVDNIINHIKQKKSNRLPPVGDGFSLNQNSPKFSDDNETFQDKRERMSNTKKSNLTVRSRYITSAPEENNFLNNHKSKKPKKASSEWIITFIPREIVKEAVFFHSVCFISCLIQYRSGRALFPVQTASRNRLLSIQDLSFSVTEYLESIDFHQWNTTDTPYTSASEVKVLEILDTLKRVKAHVNSSRMSTERQQFPYL